MFSPWFSLSPSIVTRLWEFWLDLVPPMKWWAIYRATRQSGKFSRHHSHLYCRATGEGELRIFLAMQAMTAGIGSFIVHLEESLSMIVSAGLCECVSHEQCGKGCVGATSCISACQCIERVQGCTLMAILKNSFQKFLCCLLNRLTGQLWKSAHNLWAEKESAPV